MTQIDPGQALPIFLGNMPTFIAVVLAWMHTNGRFSDMNARMADMKADLQRQNHSIEAKRTERIDQSRDLLRAEFRRVEEVWNARIKHLEERN